VIAVIAEVIAVIAEVIAVIADGLQNTFVRSTQLAPLR
jgi:hypothetical protein